MDVVFVNNIFDAFAKVSDINHKNWEIGEISEQNRNTLNTCGSCNLWMTQQCPRETKTNKVSCGQSKCEKFSIQSHYTKLVSEREEKIKLLKKEIKALISNRTK